MSPSPATSVEIAVAAALSTRAFANHVPSRVKSILSSPISSRPRSVRAGLNVVLTPAMTATAATRPGWAAASS